MSLVFIFPVIFHKRLGRRRLQRDFDPIYASASTYLDNSRVRAYFVLHNIYRSCVSKVMGSFGITMAVQLFRLFLNYHRQTRSVNPTGHDKNDGRKVISKYAGMSKYKWSGNKHESSVSAWPPWKENGNDNKKHSTDSYGQGINRHQSTKTIWPICRAGK